jgi:hypothetical protein
MYPATRVPYAGRAERRPGEEAFTVMLSCAFVPALASGEQREMYELNHGNSSDE